MQYETVKLEIEDRAATIMFDRMEKKNAASHQVFRDLEAALTVCEEDENVRVVILTGQEDVFCAGADVTGFDFQKVSQGMYFMQLVVKVFEHFEYIPKPVIMAVNGIAYGFGTGITLTEDRFGSGLAQVALGAIPDIVLVKRVKLLRLLCNDLRINNANILLARSRRNALRKGYGHAPDSQQPIRLELLSHRL